MSSVSIIIATSSRPAPLEQTLRSLFSVRVPTGWFVELLVVENGAKSGLEAMLDQSARATSIAVGYLFEPRRGKSNALNLALAKAKGEILLFTDDDVRFPVDWMERMCEPIRGGRADAVAGGVRLAPHLRRPWMNRTHRAWLASTADYLSADNPSELCGANMAMSRQVFERVGGFDPELGPGITGGGEESLLSWQLKQANFRLAGLTDLSVEHHFDVSRLQYRNWIKAAQDKGSARAYLRHHWHHQKVPCPRLVKLYHRAKLSLRQAFSGRKRADDEGIAPWELSYLETIAFCAGHIQQRRRPRNYARHGLRKVPAKDRPAGS
jgi:glycosyltransferase involved in cell wall biosynthesis